MKIHRTIPASLKLIDLAKAGVAVRVINPTINPANQNLLPFNILCSLFPNSSDLNIAFHVPT